MIKSMTAYGCSETEYNGTVYNAEIKTLNNRYRDIILRIPSSLQDLEDMIRNQISAGIRRGRVEVSLQASRKNGETFNSLELNRPLINSYIQILAEMKEEFGLDSSFKPDFLFQIRDAIVARPESIDTEEIKPAIEELLGRALESMDEMRIREGRTLEDDLLKRLDLINGYITEIEKRSPLVIQEYKERLNNRIKTISDEMEVDEARLAQEVAMFAARADITEEIVRARSHMDQFREYLRSNDSIGRRLDFLTQELNREVNTISSKASDSAISRNAVEVKAELERIREQIQNVE